MFAVGFEEVDFRAASPCCASQTWPIVGNSNSPMTTLRRALKSSALAMALMPAEAQEVIATSSGLAPMKAAKTARASSYRSTQ